MRKLLDVDNVLESHRESLSKIHQQVARGEPVVGTASDYAPSCLTVLPSHSIMS